MRYAPVIAIICAIHLTTSTASLGQPYEPGRDQTTGMVSGQVTLRATGEPLPHATVLIEGRHRRTVTDAEGRYAFEGVAAGTHRVIAFMGGLGDAVQTVAVTAGETATADFELRLEVQVPEITVTAGGREELAARALSSVTTLDQSQLEKLAQPGIGEVLEHQPGVAKRSFGSPGTSRPIVRGFDGDRVLILQDGIRTGTLSSQSGDHGELVDVTSLERLEVVKGPATLLYGGNALGGVVNAVSPYQGFREGLHRGVRGGATLMAGSSNEFGGGSGRLEASDGAWDMWGGGGYQRTDSYRTPRGLVPNSDTVLKEGFTGVGRYGERSFASLSYRYAEGDYGVPFVGGENDEEGGEHDEEIDLASRLHTVRLATGWRDVSRFLERLELTASYSDWRHRELENGQTGTVFDNRQAVYRATLDQARRGRLSGSSGFWGMYRDYEVTGAEALSPPVTQHNVAAFTLQEIDLGPGRIQLGARVERTTYDPDSSGRPARFFTGLSAAGGVHVTPWTGGALVANYQHAYRAPALEELYNFGPHPGNAVFEIGDEDLASERSDGIDLSIRQSSSRLRGSLSYFYYDIADFVFLAPTGERDGALSVARHSQADSRYRGFEARLDAQLHSSLWLKGGLDRVDAELKESGTPLPRIPPLSGFVSADFSRGGLTLGPELVLTAAQDDVFFDETPTDGYEVLNLNASYALAVGATVHRLTVRAFNLTDELYFNHTSFIKERAPEIGRGIRVLYSVRVF